jgi:hypothetical protein
MSIGEIHTALAVRQGGPTTKDFYIINFEPALSVSSLGLVEVNDGKVQFIHSSIKEYLTTANPSKSTFKASKTEAHLSLSLACLSYLTYDIPKTPLSWYSKTAVSSLPHLDVALQGLKRGTTRILETDPLGPSEEERKAEFRRNLQMDYSVDNMLVAEANTINYKEKRGAEIRSHFPLLKYAARHWHQHAFESLSGSQLPLSSQEFASCLDFLALLSTFMLDRNHVAIWVEACAIYGFIPNLYFLITPFSRLGYHNLAPGSAQREFLWMTSGLKQLAAALKDLWARHSNSILSKPSAIWSETLRASIDHDFWPAWEPPENKKDENPDDDTGVRVNDGGLSSFVASH